MRYAVLTLMGLFLLAAPAGQARALGDKAQELRQQNALMPFSPPEAFLAGAFLADEMNPAYVFGPVKAFAAARACPTAWLIEEGEKGRLDKRPRNAPEPFEYTLFLEEDCGAHVVHYVFVDQSGVDSKQWMEWRRQFHKNKVEGQFNAAKGKLEKAAEAGAATVGELRFLLKDGDLQTGRPEEILQKELKVKPLYDLGQGRKL